MEDIHIALWPHWVKSRHAIHHPDRDSVNGELTMYSQPLRKWIRAKRISQTHMRVQYFDQCPCRFS